MDDHVLLAGCGFYAARCFVVYQSCLSLETDIIYFSVELWFDFGYNCFCLYLLMKNPDIAN